MSKWTDTIEGLKLSHDGTQDYETAIEALRAMEERDNPKPLTLDQLKERVGKPVWFKPVNNDEGWWRVISRTEPLDGDAFYFTDSYCWRNAYGKTWLAYDHEPKESE